MTSWVGTQLAKRMNQNEITSGRSKRSQTRIAPGAVIWQAEARRLSGGQGISEVSQSSWKTLASASSGPVVASGTADSGRALPASNVLWLAVLMVLIVASTMSARNASPTKIE